MSYYAKVLRDDEKVLFLGELHPIIYVRAALLLLGAAILGVWWLVAGKQQAGWSLMLACTCVLMLCMGLGSLLDAWIRRRTTEIVVTNLRVIIKRGLIRRFTVEMNMSKIETVDVVQGIIARLLGFGTVNIRGTGAGLEPLRRISAPVALRNAILVG